MHRIGQLVRRQAGDLLVNISCETLAPRPHLAQEKVVKLIGTVPGHIDGEAAIKIARVHRLTRQKRPQLVEARFKLFVSDKQNTRDMRFIGVVWRGPAVIDRQLMKVGQDRDRQACRITVAPRLEGGIPTPINAHIRLLGFDEELALACKAQLIVRLLGKPLFADFNRCLFDNFPKPERLAGDVVYVPSKCREQRRDKIRARLRLIIGRTQIICFVAPEVLDKISHPSTGSVLRVNGCHAVCFRAPRRREFRRFRICVQTLFKRSHSADVSPMCSRRMIFAFSSRTSSSRPARTS